MISYGFANEDNEDKFPNAKVEFRADFQSRILTNIDEIAFKLCSPKHCLTKLKPNLTKLLLHDEINFILTKMKLLIYPDDEYKLLLWWVTKLRLLSAKLKLKRYIRDIIVATSCREYSRLLKNKIQVNER